MDQNGIVRYGDEGMQRYTVNGKISAELAPWLKAHYNMKFIRRDLDQPYKLDDNLFYYDTTRRWPTSRYLTPTEII